MTKTDLLAIQTGFVARAEGITAFLCAATDLFKAANHVMTELEAAGFHACIQELRRNMTGVCLLDGMIHAEGKP